MRVGVEHRDKFEPHRAPSTLRAPMKPCASGPATESAAGCPYGSGANLVLPRVRPVVQGVTRAGKPVAALPVRQGPFASLVNEKHWGRFTTRKRHLFDILRSAPPQRSECAPMIERNRLRACVIDAAPVHRRYLTQGLAAGHDSHDGGIVAILVSR